MDRRTFLAASGAPLAFPFIACSRQRESGVPPGILQDGGFALAHRLRDGGAFPEPTETRRVPVLIVGAGIGGLSAAWRFSRRGFADFTLLELAGRPGGNSRYVERGDGADQNPVSAHPLGAHYLPLPPREAVHVRELLADLGAIEGDPYAAKPVYDERRLCHEPRERLYRDGWWQDGLMPQRGLPRAERGEIARFLERMAEFRAARDAEGRRAFALPAALSSPDPRWRALDALSMRDWMRQEGFVSPALDWYVDYACRDDFGTRAAETSAWAGIHYFACRDGEAANATPDTVLTAPEGNGWIVRALVGRVGARLETDALVYRLRPTARAVVADVFLPGEGRSRRIHCQWLVWAAPLFLLPKLVDGGEDACPAAWRASVGALEYAPWLVANVTVAEPPPAGAGAPLAWDNVPYGGAGLGYVVANHQDWGRVPGPRVLTCYQALADGPPAEVRRQLLAASRQTLARATLAELSAMHPGIAATVTRLDVFRHGHAMVRPRPGLLWSEPRRRLARGWGRIAIAHADASGLSLFEEANFRGVEAADKILAALGR